MLENLPAWQFIQQEFESARHFASLRNGAPATYREVVSAWRSDPAFRTTLTELLREVPFDAYFWETPPITHTTFDRHFEFVVVDAPVLAGARADGRPFAEHLADDATFTTFHNLGRDALLVAPCPGHDADYAHLAAFLRTAPAARCHDLWSSVAAAVDQRLSDEPLWLNTSGAGVHWLHVRLDSRPKYYQWNPYRALP